MEVEMKKRKTILGYCLKCRKKREMIKMQFNKKNERYFIKSKCTKCDRTISRFIKKNIGIKVADMILEKVETEISPFDINMHSEILTDKIEKEIENIQGMLLSTYENIENKIC